MSGILSRLGCAAAASGDIALVHTLLDAAKDKAILYGPDSDGITALHAAAVAGHLHIVKFLVTHGHKVRVLACFHQLTVENQFTRVCFFYFASGQCL